MLITAKTEIKGIHLELSVADAKAVLRNPKKLQTELRVILENYGVELGSEYKGGKEEVDKSLPHFPCPWCEKVYKYQAYLNRHTEKCPNHPGNVTTVDA
jgi:hypothetical protein